jgi:hypothetical protein
MSASPAVVWCPQVFRRGRGGDLDGHLRGYDPDGPWGWSRVLSRHQTKAEALAANARVEEEAKANTSWHGREGEYRALRYRDL